MSVVPARPGLFSVKIGGSSLQRPEMKGTHGYTCFFLPSKPRARVTPPLLDGHPVHRTSGALGSGPLPTPHRCRRPRHPSVSFAEPTSPPPWSPSSPSPQPLQEVMVGLMWLKR